MKSFILIRQSKSKKNSRINSNKVNGNNEFLLFYFNYKKLKKYANFHFHPQRH